MNSTDKLLSRVVFYGGIPTPLGEVVADLQAIQAERGLPATYVDRYLQGLLYREALEAKSPS